MGAESDSGAKGRGSEPAGVPLVPAQLRWRCRRGMRELDRLLEGFVDTGYNQLKPRQKQRFAEILDFPDPDLHAYLVGKIEPADAELGQLLNLIRESLAPRA